MGKTNYKSKVPYFKFSDQIDIQIDELKNNKDYLNEILNEGMIKAKEKSDPVIREVKSIVGLGQ